MTTNTAAPDTEQVAVAKPATGRTTLHDVGKALNELTGNTAPSAPTDSKPTSALDSSPLTGSIGIVERSELSPRERFLEDASVNISEEKAEQYGEARPCFERIALIWESIMGHPVTVEQVALAMAGVKIARLAHNPTHTDSWVDMAGYAALGGELAEGTGA